MRKMTIKLAVAALAVAAFASGSFAIESPKIQATTTNPLRTTASLSSAMEQPVRTKVVAMSSAVSEGRSTHVTSTLEESNTIGMLLAGLAIMALVVRRRMS